MISFLRNSILFLLCMTLYSAHSQTIPNAMPGLQAWWSADSLKVGNGNPIETWTTNNNEFLFVTQPTAANRPTLIDNVLNGKPVVRFDGVNDYLDGGDILDIGSGGQTIFLIGKSIAQNGAYISKALYGNQSNRYAIEYDKQWSKGFLFLHQDNIGNNSIETENNPFGNNEIITTIVNNSIKKNFLFINSLLINYKSISGTAMNSSYNFLLGAYNNTTGTIPPQAGYYLNGDIAEIIIYNRPLTQLERQDIENYLRMKYFPGTERLQFTLGPDIVEPYSLAPITLTVPPKPYYQSYEWNTGATTASIQVHASGTSG